jgi:hypothetical protein
LLHFSLVSQAQFKLVSLLPLLKTTFGFEENPLGISGKVKVPLREALPTPPQVVSKDDE